MMMTNAEYHNDLTADSNSMLKTFAKSPALYEALNVTKTIEKQEPTPDMVVGSVTHTLWLQPEKFAAEYAVKPQCDRRTKGGKATYADFLLESAGKQEIDAESYALASAMVAALNANEFAKALRESAGAIVEMPIRWTDSATGLALKAKPDLYAPAGGTDWALCVDLKTTADPGEAFARQVANLAYYRQAAFYLDGCRACYDADSPTKFLLVAVGKEPPHDVYVYHLGGDWISQGVAENAALLRRLAECKASGVWRTPEQLTVSELPPPPKWLTNRGE